MANKYSVAKGYYSPGKLKFNLSNKPMFDLAVKAFNNYSQYANNAVYLNYFLQSLQIVSKHEGGFDSVNSYDKAGISVGFLQFARPEDNVYQLLNIFNPVLANTVRNSFGNADPHKDVKSLTARTNTVLINQVKQAIVTPAGIEAQLQLAIQDYYDASFTKFLTFTFSPEVDQSQFGIANTVNQSLGNVSSNNLFTTGLSTQSNDYSPFKIYALALLFDTAVNRGVGSLKDFKQINVGGIPASEGNWIRTHIQGDVNGQGKIFIQPNRREIWTNLLATNFTTGILTA